MELTKKKEITSASVKDWCTSLHGILGPPDKSSPNSGNKCQMARPLKLPNFLVLQQKGAKYPVSKIFDSHSEWKTGSKFTKIA